MINRILKIAELVEAADNSNVKLVAQCKWQQYSFKEINVYVGTDETVIVLENELEPEPEQEPEES